MGAALQTVVDLDVEVKLQTKVSGKDDSSAGMRYITGACNPGVTKPFDFSLCSEASRSGLSSLTLDVCSRLAPKVPSLQWLLLVGCFRDAALGAFGSHCLLLTSLQIPAITLELNQGMDKLVPQLQQLTIIGSEQLRKQGVITPYLETLFPLLHDCDRLEQIELIVTLDYGQEDNIEDDDLIIRCATEAWNQLPESLTCFQCDANVEWPQGENLFLERIQRLGLKEFIGLACDDLSAIIQQSPNLQELWITRNGDPSELLWGQRPNYTPSEEEVVLLKTRLLGGLLLHVRSAGLTGDVALIKDVTSCLSPVMETERCEVITYGDMLVGWNFLEKLAVVFPNLQHLVVDSGEGKDWITVDESLLEPMPAFRSLKTLDLRWISEYTVAGLIDLCLSMPTLTGVYCLPRGHDACYAAAMSNLASRGRQVAITSDDNELYGPDQHLL